MIRSAWTPVEAGVYRVNQARDDDFAVKCSPAQGEALPLASSDYDPQPREYVLTSVTTTIEVDTRVSDLFRSPMDQVKEQLSLTIEKLKEKQENEVLNNKAYGLLNNADPEMRLKPRKGPPTPDDLDSLISLVWKEPTFFLAHPRAIRLGLEIERDTLLRRVEEEVGAALLGVRHVTERMHTWRVWPILATPPSSLHADNTLDYNRTRLHLFDLVVEDKETAHGRQGGCATSRLARASS